MIDPERVGPEGKHEACVIHCSVPHQTKKIFIVKKTQIVKETKIVTT